MKELKTVQPLLSLIFSGGRGCFSNCHVPEHPFICLAKSGTSSNQSGLSFLFSLRRGKNVMESVFLLIRPNRTPTRWSLIICTWTWTASFTPVHIQKTSRNRSLCIWTLVVLCLLPIHSITSVGVAVEVWFDCLLTWSLMHTSLLRNHSPETW